MTIGFDASRAFTQNRTGTENYSFQLLKNLSLIDQNNNYYIYLRPEVVVNKSQWPENFYFKTIPFSRLWTQVGLAGQTFIDKNLDVLFIPSHTLPLIHRPGLKTVVTVHDLGAEFLPSTHQIKQRIYLNFMTNYQLKSASHIIAVSQATKDDLVKKIGLSENKITVIHEGYNQELFKPIKNSQIAKLLDQYNLKKDSYFLFVGTIQPRKNLERLIKAYANFLIKVRGVTAKRALAAAPAANTWSEDGRRETEPAGPRAPCLVLAGSKGWKSDEIYTLPKKLGIEDQVKFLGYVPDEDLPALYSGAIALLFPSLFEGFGLPILEAQACGCPVLTSNISSMPEVASDSAILVDPYSIDEITQGMGRFINDDFRFKMKEKGFKNIKRFSWEKAAQETLKVLRSFDSGSTALTIAQDDASVNSASLKINPKQIRS